MRIARTVVAVVFWLLAVVAVVPAAAEIYPVVLKMNGAGLSPSAVINAAGAETAVLSTAAPWLIVAALLAVNGTLLCIWNSLAKL